jgi:hypothetical protein
MVMTQDARPRQSLRGLALASTLIALGWVLMPAVNIAQNSTALPTPAAPVAHAEVSVTGGVVGTTPAGTVPTPAPAAATTPLYVTTGTPAPFMVVGTSEARGEESVSRVYHVSAGKLEALTKLLARDDVPLNVRPQPSGIEIIATPGQHEQISAFIREIDPKAGPQEMREYPLPEGKLDALYELLSRDDVPIFVNQDDGVLRADVTPQQDQVLRGFLTFIDPGGKTPRPAPTSAHSARGRQKRGGSMPPLLMPPTSPTPPSPPPPPAPPAPSARAAGAPRAYGHEATRYQRQALETQLEHLRAQQELQQQQGEQYGATLRAKAAEIDEKAEELQAQIDEVQEKAEQLREAADSGENAGQGKQLEKQARELERSARRLEHELERLSSLSAELEDQADDAESHGEQLDSTIEELESQLSDLDDDGDDSDEADTDSADDDDAQSWIDADTPLADAQGRLAMPPQVTIPGAPMLGLYGYTEPSVREVIGWARQDLRGRVRSSLREALKSVPHSSDFADQELDALCDRISEAVSVAVTKTLEKRLNGGEIRVSTSATASTPGHAEASGRAGGEDCEPTPAPEPEHPMHDTPLP